MLELEGPPSDVEGQAVGRSFDGGFQSSFADVAPGSDGVGDDVDGDDAAGGGRHVVSNGER